MIHQVVGEPGAMGEGPFARSVNVESSWGGGTVHMRTVSSGARCERTLRRSELAIGIGFQNPGSAVQWCLDGKVVLDKSWTAQTRSRDLIVLPPDHKFQACCQGSGQGLWMFIEPRALSDDDQIKSFAEEVRIDASWAKNRLSWMLATELRNECEQGFPRGLLFLEAASMALVSQLAHMFGGQAQHYEPVRALSGRKLCSVIDFMQSHLDHNITLSELAGLVDITPRYFCEVFKQAMGCSPHQYQIERRIERAKYLLRRPGMSVAEVALAVGFSSQSHLNVYFRRAVGLTPARYRQEIGRNTAV